MSCRFCVHWAPDPSTAPSAYGQATEGACHRYPAEKTVSVYHHCGEILIDSYMLRRIGQLFDKLDGARKNIEDERDKRIAAEKKLKELRSKIRNYGNPDVVAVDK